jgi:DNA-directed RNA polymerase specialized sigma24 family protein
LALTPQRPQDVQTAACPCRHGDVPAELAGQRPLLERAAAGDREAFALVYDDQVEGVYRYLLAWTGDRAEAAELTAQVFHAATGWLPSTIGAEGEAGAWLIAMARDATAQRPRPSPAAGPARDVVAAVARLGEPEREVVVLRLLLGHSLDHTAHLSGYSRRAAMELQLAACLAVHEVTVGPPPGDDALSGPPGTAATGALMGGDLSGRARAATPPEAHTAPSAEEFERRLGLREVDLTGSDPTLADSLTSMDPAVAGALTAASALRRAAPEHVADSPSEFVQRLRRELVTAPGAVTAASTSQLGRLHSPSGASTTGGRGFACPSCTSGAGGCGSVRSGRLRCAGGRGVARTRPVRAAGGGEVGRGALVRPTGGCRLRPRDPGQAVGRSLVG